MSISYEKLREFQREAEKVANASKYDGSFFSVYLNARDRELIRLAVEHDRANNVISGQFVGAMHNEYIRGVNDERRRILRCLGLDIANPIAKTGD